MRKLAVCSLLVVLACLSLGQAWNYRRDPLGFQVLLRPDVAKELKLKPEQSKRIKAMQTSYVAAASKAWDDDSAGGGRAGMMKRMRATRQELSTLLDAGQKKRFGEIKVQLMGMGVVLDREIQPQLGLTAAQYTALGNLYAQAGSKGPTDQEIAKLLTPQQITKIKGLGGKPFKH